MEKYEKYKPVFTSMLNHLLKEVELPYWFMQRYWGCDKIHDMCGLPTFE